MNRKFWLAFVLLLICCAIPLVALLLKTPPTPTSIEGAGDTYTSPKWYCPACESRFYVSGPRANYGDLQTFADNHIKICSDPNR